MSRRKLLERIHCDQMKAQFNKVKSIEELLHFILWGNIVCKLTTFFPDIEQFIPR